MTRASAIAAAQARFNDGRFLRDLRELVAIPTENQDPRGRPALDAYLTDAMRPRLESVGFSCRVVANPKPGYGPFLIASDGPRLSPERPTLFMGARGGVTIEM
jgi:acetylornithine deacetylase/succinyl-diaminopimelate desuccinylase-like protein